MRMGSLFDAQCPFQSGLKGIQKDKPPVLWVGLPLQRKPLVSLRTPFRPTMGADRVYPQDSRPGTRGKANVVLVFKVYGAETNMSLLWAKPEVVSFLPPPRVHFLCV